MLPAGYQPGRRYPCIVQIHGGPESAYLDGWLTGYVAWGELLAARGYVVFSPNYRGSVGRGVAYAKADHKDLGGREFEDVLDGIEYLAREGYVDKGRVGMGGFSYGGYFSALAATRYSEHFRAASMGAGIANWLSFTGTSDIPYENSMVHWNLDVFKNMPLVWDRSPLAHVEKSQTALLISHGEKDERVPISQSWELYTAMKMLDKTVQFDIYPREPHGFLERNHQLQSINRNLEWFERYVKDQ
jgi:dipeptidyl aminopeptidase/acylaminoacyl peptidase